MVLNVRIKMKTRIYATPAVRGLKTRKGHKESKRKVNQLLNHTQILNPDLSSGRSDVRTDGRLSVRRQLVRLNSSFLPFKHPQKLTN